MSFFRIKDNIILAKSVLIEEKALHLRRFFCKQSEKRKADTPLPHETPARRLAEMKGKRFY